MKKKLLREFYALCEGGICQDLLNEQRKERGVRTEHSLSCLDVYRLLISRMAMGAYIQMMYLRREIQQLYKGVVKDNRACGELDHPDDSVVNLKNVSHILSQIFGGKAKDVMGKIKVLDTPSGRILKDLVNAGVKLGNLFSRI